MKSETVILIGVAGVAVLAIWWINSNKGNGSGTGTIAGDIGASVVNTALTQGTNTLQGMAWGSVDWAEQTAQAGWNNFTSFFGD